MVDLTESFELLATETADLFAPRVIKTIDTAPTAFDFLKNHVTANEPLLIKGGAQHWQAIRKWSPDYLIEKLRDKMVTVAVTPNGYADAITDSLEDGDTKKYFAVPEERSILVSDLFAKLRNADRFVDDSVRLSKGIFYLQKQDSNLTKECPELLTDVEKSLPWASEAFGCQPSAVNLWVGDARSVTSLHKDPFENIYGVVSGYKDFILLPPTDRPWLPYKTFRVAQYKEVEPGKFILEPVEGEDSATHVPWITVDPLSCKDPEYLSNAHPLHVRVEAGDLMYLPSLWFHHVRQSDNCIAVNFWYDMVMDVKFVYYQFLDHLSRIKNDENDPILENLLRNC